MDQPTFADLEYESKKRETRREIFLERMDSLIPWEQLEERIRQFYPKEGRAVDPMSCLRCCEYTACSCSTTSAIVKGGDKSGRVAEQKCTN